MMRDLVRNNRRLIFIVMIGLISVISLFVKLTYFGWKYQDHGSAGDYSVVSYRTIRISNPLASGISDGYGGYYRIFDKRGAKVFELASDSFAFDVVLVGSSDVEFQLSDDTHVWQAPRSVR